MKDEKIVEPCSNCLKHLREKSTKFVEENKICGRKKNLLKKVKTGSDQFQSL